MDRLEKLRYQLLENDTWPLPYMFKFIVPNKDGKVEKIQKILENTGRLSYKHTRNLKHVAITCVAKMNSADDIIDITEKVGAIEGVLVL